jgi:hypothetical protein
MPSGPHPDGSIGSEIVACYNSPLFGEFGAEAMDNRRAAVRLRKFKSGKVSFGNCQVPCTVRSLSESGASLQVQTTYGIPGVFELTVSGEPSKACKVTWADEKQFGVQFT